MKLELVALVTSFNSALSLSLSRLGNDSQAVRVVRVPCQHLRQVLARVHFEQHLGALDIPHLDVLLARRDRIRF